MLASFFFFFLGSQPFDRGCEVPKKCVREKSKKKIAWLTSFSYFCLSLHFWDATLFFFFFFLCLLLVHCWWL